MMNDAVTLDAADPLASWAASFHKQPGEIYLDGNSLGLLSHQAEAALLATLHDWKTRGIQGWTEGMHPWFGMSREVAGLLAPLIGASPESVTLGESVTVLLHQLIASFRPRGSTLLLDELAFPTDHYVAASQVRGFGGQTVVCRSQNGLTLDEAALEDALATTPGLGLALLPSVLYRSGQLLDMRRLTAIARQRGIIILWDCSHSVGVVPHQLQADGVQLAVGCTYKYLNGGPGAVAFGYVQSELLHTQPAFQGWFGSDPAKQFAMESTFTPANDAGRFLLGTPHILSLAPLLGSLPMIATAGMEAIRAKSLALTTFLQERAYAQLAQYGVLSITPREDAQRGGHLTLRHPDAAALSTALRQRDVIPDFRPPDLLRLAPAPLYTSFGECARAVDILEELLRTGTYRNITRHGLVT